jgi:hypothetical protein
LFQARAFTHVLETVLKQEENSPINKALARSRITDMKMFVQLQPDDVMNLQYLEKPEGSSASTPKALQNLHFGESGLLKAFLGYFEQVRDAAHTEGDFNGWLDMTAQAFDNFRVGPAYKAYLASQGAAPVAYIAPRPQVSAGGRSYDPVTDFRKSIKCDSSVYPTFKDEKEWDSWQRETLAHAHAQNIGDVFDPTYKPGLNPEAATLFRAQCDFVFSVFVKTLQLDYGKHLVRTLGNQPQEIYKLLVKEMSKSTRAILASQTLHSFITGYRLTDSSWKGTTTSFVLYWRDQMRKYESINETINKADPAQKLNWLRNAVEGVQTFADLRKIDDNLQRVTGKPLNYEECFDMILNEAGRYDVHHSSSPQRFTPASRTVYVHDTRNEYHGSEDSPETSFTLDTPNSVVMAYAAASESTHTRGFGNPRPATTDSRPQLPDYVPRDKWEKMSAEERRAVQQKRLSDMARSTNMHAVTYEYLLANLHQIYLGSDGDVDDPPQHGTEVYLDANQESPAPDTGDPSKTVPVVCNEAQRGTDAIAKPPAKSPAGPFAKMMGGSTRYTGKTDTSPSELTIDGHLYRKVSS